MTKYTKLNSLNESKIIKNLKMKDYNFYFINYTKTFMNKPHMIESVKFKNNDYTYGFTCCLRDLEDKHNVTIQR